jgi:carboxyl-terminal processing protease
MCTLITLFRSGHNPGNGVAMRRFWFVIVTTTISYGQWPSPKTAIEAYDFVQQRRTEAEKLWQNGDARGIDLLKNTLPYLEQPLVVDLAAGNRYLAARRANIYLDLAEAYAIQAKPDESLNYLEKVAEEMPDPAIAKLLEGQKSFEAVRREPRFSKILNGFRRYDQFWDSKALSTPFEENLSEAEKLAGLGKFWAEVKYNFGYPEKLVALDWDNLYLQ